MKKTFLAILLALFCSTTAHATTYYVRTDGSNQTNCLGTTDAAYDGDGTGEACAFSHPAYAIGFCIVYQDLCTTSSAISAGDTVVIHGPDDGAGTGIYQMGYNSSIGCNESYTTTCTLNDIVDGTAEAHVKIVGCSASGCGSDTRPELWGAGGANAIIYINDSDYIDISDIEITDHASEGDCTVSTASTCGKIGIRGDGWSNITLTNVYIHGLGLYGAYIGDGENLTLTNTEISGNGQGGINGDTGSSGYTGTITLDTVTMEYNGCVEDYTNGGLVDESCIEQNQGGYGDAIGTSTTSGDWVITDSNISFNTSDGLDLLYLDDSGTVTIKRSRFEGNNGNQVKITNQAYIEDCLIIGNCGYFYGQDFTDTTAPGFTHCRASGNALEIAFKTLTDSPKIYNSTILSNGDVGVNVSGTCTTGTDVILSNNIMYGGKEFMQDSDITGGGNDDTTSIFYDGGGTCDVDFVETYNICYGWKEGANSCNGTGSTDEVDPLFSGTILMGPYSTPGYYTDSNYDAQLILQATSTAIDEADETVTGADAYDYTGASRGTSWDIGAIEYGSTLDEEEEDTTPTMGWGCAMSGGVGFE